MALGPSQPPVQWLLGAVFFRGRMASWPFPPGWCKAYNESSYTCIPSYADM